MAILSYITVVVFLMMLFATFEQFMRAFNGPGRILSLLSLSLLLRVVWGLLHEFISAEGYGMRLINRLIILVQLSAIFLLVLQWGECLAQFERRCRRVPVAAMV